MLSAHRPLSLVSIHLFQSPAPGAASDLAVFWRSRRPGSVQLSFSRVYFGLGPAAVTGQLVLRQWPVQRHASVFTFLSISFHTVLTRARKWGFHLFHIYTLFANTALNKNTLQLYTKAARYIEFIATR